MDSVVKDFDFVDAVGDIFIVLNSVVDVVFVVDVVGDIFIVVNAVVDVVIVVDAVVNDVVVIDDDGDVPGWADCSCPLADLTSLPCITTLAGLQGSGRRSCVLLRGC